jgi:hypothetical protein
MIIETSFNIGDAVQLKTQVGIMRIVTGYVVRQKQVSYFVTEGANETCHQDFELELVKREKIKGFK